MNFPDLLAADFRIRIIRIGDSAVTFLPLPPPLPPFAASKEA